MAPYPSTPLTGKEIRKATRAAVAAIEANGLRCCVFGSVACAIYGMEHREPNDVDIVVLTNKTQGDIKDLIESTDDQFYLVPAANPQDTYHVLWYSIPDADERACKVDILIPGILSIPEIPIQTIVYQDPFSDIPVVPLFCLILLKLRGWTDHCADPRQRMRDRVPVDEDDIDELLELAVKEYGAHLEKEEWMPEWFVREARERVGQYILHNPASRDSWVAIGFGNYVMHVWVL